MKVSLDWIKDFVDLNASPEEVAHRLTMAGLEIEGMEHSGSDVLMEVNVTPNRPDCLNILGIAREAAAAFHQPLKSPQISLKNIEGPTDIIVEIDDQDLCNRYSGRLITGVKVGESPDWMKERLEKCGIRAINNIVDITNYVLLELGHPLHAFDADKLSGKQVRVARAGSNRMMTTLDSIEREIPEDTLLIWDGSRPVAIAGIMGGEGSSVTPATKNVFLESAHFNPVSIRRSSKSLGLKSESSYRFERGADIVFLETALNRASELIQQISGGAVHDIVDAYPSKYERTSVTVQYSKVNSLIGIEIGKDNVKDILGTIGIEIEDRGNSFVAYPPSFRGDIREPIDVIEEVTRCYGYEKIPARTPKSPLSDGILNSRERNIHKIREAARKAGFTEVINYSFMNSADLDLLSIPEDDRRRKCINLMNPLRQEDSLMRTTLLPALLNNFVYNLSRSTRNISVFETSRVFINTGSQLPDEELRFSGIFFRDSSPAMWQENIPAFYIVKGALQSIFEEMNVRGYSMIPSAEPFLHRGKAADIIFNGRTLGFIGEIGPNVIERLNLKIKKPEIIVFELDLDALLSMADITPAYTHIPKFPSIERDIALIVDDSMTLGEILGLLRQYSSPVIESVEPFDYYKGKNIPSDKKSLGIRITYRSKDRTLTDSEIETLHSDLVEYILSKTGCTLRGA